MKKFLELFTQTVAVLATALLFLFLLKTVKIGYPFLWELVSKSQLVPSIVTFVVGLVAYWVYWKQREDRKRDMASLILQEIRYAEDIHREAKSRDNVYKYAQRLLPTNNWNNNVHLFVSDLEQSQIDAISRFYSSVEFIDKIVLKIADDAMEPPRPPQMVQAPLIPTPPTGPASEPQSQPNQFQILIQTPNGGANVVLNAVSNEVEYIYSSSAADVLRKIANKQ